MKKNKMMRIASVLLIVTILSTCAISGTFAKYVITGEGEGAARVAKWGIQITMTGNDLFSTEYDYTDRSAVHYPRAWDLAVVADDAVVAPGTNSEEAAAAGGADFKPFGAHIEGTPEVAVRYTLGFDAETIKDIVLTDGQVIKDETVVLQEGEDYADYTVQGDYSPVKFTIHFDGKIAGRDFQFDFPAVSLTDFQALVDGDAELAQLLDRISYNGVKAYVEDGKLCFDCPAGKSIEGDFTCTWEWFYDVPEYNADGTVVKDADGKIVYTGSGANDVMDTYLGNHALDDADQDGEPDYAISFAFVAAATQID